MRRSEGPALLGALGVLFAGSFLAGASSLGAISMQMIHHTALMNVIAPLLAIVLARKFVVTSAPPGALAIVAAIQVALLLIYHTPMVQRGADGSAFLHLAIAAALLIVATVFWLLVVVVARRQAWASIVALLLTGKVTCLLGALLIFAPRDLFAIRGVDLWLCASGPSDLADQGFAGLLMIAACPLSYVVSGIGYAIRMLSDLEQEQSWRPPALAGEKG